MNILGGGYGNQAEMSLAKSETPVHQRTLTEQLKDRIAYHKSEIDKINAALEALTPDVERALNALSKL